MIALPLLDGDTLLVDNSTMELQQTCPRNAQYGICLRKRATGERSAQKFGGIAHKILETRYLSTAPLYAQTDDITKVMLAKAYDEFSHWTPHEDDFRTLDCAVRLIRAYGDRYPFEDFDILRTPDGRPFVEVPFMRPLAEVRVDGTFWVQNLTKNAEGDIVKSGPPVQKYLSTIKVVFMGRIDLVYRSHGGVYVMDHKTSSIATNMAEFELSHQFYGYTNAVEEMIDAPVAGIVINRMVCRKPTRTGEAITLERKLIPVQRGLVAEWKTDMTHIVVDFIEMVRRGYMPKHTQWCVGKFGTCQFHKVCSLDSEEQREMMLTSGEFEDNVWNPLK